MDSSKGKGYGVALVGATGAVGGKVLQVLEERGFPVGELRLLASQRSAGKTIRFRGSDVEVRELGRGAFVGMDLAFFASDAEVSREFAPQAAAEGALAIDKSSVFRMDPDVPLVVPEVNAADMATAERRIIATPNCTTIQLVVAIAPLHAEAGIRRLLVDTYQAVSGAGIAGIEDLEQGIQARYEGRPSPKMKAMARQIAFNVVPHIDKFGPDGFTGEETKVIRETRKIMHLPDLAVTCTAVRVPVYVGHAEAVTIETERTLTPARAKEILGHSRGVVLMDDPAQALYPTPIDAAERDEVLVGRIRTDPSAPNSLHLWVVSDNLRKGAATNAVQIAEHHVGLAR